MDELSNLARLTHEQKDELIRTLVAKVHQLSALVEELQARLSKDSHNSSKPPSSDGLAKKTHSLRVSSGKKPGGQDGHPGATLKRSQHVDKVIDSPLPECCQA